MSWPRYIVVSIVSGILFGVLDGLINANQLARRLYEVFQPIARTSINVPAGLVIDLVYGFVMAGVFVLFYQSLPGQRVGVYQTIQDAEQNAQQDRNDQPLNQRHRRTGAE